MPRAIHFEINTGDPERTVEFYKNTFDLRIQKCNEKDKYWIITGNDHKGPEVSGAVFKKNEETAFYDKDGTSYVCTIDVPDIDTYLQKVIKNGGRIEIPKTSIPGVGPAIFCRDCEGNIFAMFSDRAH